MIGGWVIEITSDRLWCVNGSDELAVHFENDRDVRLPELGEEIWWQAGRIYYGGPDPKHGEISLRKFGYSHDPRAAAIREGEA